MPQATTTTEFARALEELATAAQNFQRASADHNNAPIDNPAMLAANGIAYVRAEAELVSALQEAKVLTERLAQLRAGKIQVVDHSEAFGGKAGR